MSCASATLKAWPVTLHAVRSIRKYASWKSRYEMTIGLVDVLVTLIDGGTYPVHDVLLLLVACVFITGRPTTLIESDAVGDPDDCSESVTFCPSTVALAGVADCESESVVVAEVEVCTCSGIAMFCAIGAVGEPPPPLHDASASDVERAKRTRRRFGDIASPPTRVSISFAAWLSPAVLQHLCNRAEVRPLSNALRNPEPDDWGSFRNCFLFSPRKEIGSPRTERSAMETVTNAFLEPRRELPTGVVTFLFTDIEGSTVRWERDPVAMQRALREHDEIMRDAIASAGGVVFKTVGDAFYAAFQTADAAVESAVASQRRLAETDFEHVDGLRVRMALHTGTGRRARRRLFRSSTESRRAPALDRSRRPDLALERERATRPRAFAGRRDARGPRRASAQRSHGAGAGLRPHRPRPRERVPETQVAQHPRQQPAAAADEPDRSRLRRACGQGPHERMVARDGDRRGRSRQDARRPCRPAPKCSTPIPTAYGSSISHR